MRSRLGLWAIPILATLGLLTFALAPATAGAQTYPAPTTTSTTDPCIGSGGIVTHVNGLSFCSTSQVHTAASSSSGLAFTGANIALMVVVALTILIAGFVLVRLSRRPQPTP
jgi:hypothetical protein